jgi:hypothetical protein
MHFNFWGFFVVFKNCVKGSGFTWTSVSYFDVITKKIVFFITKIMLQKFRIFHYCITK